MCLLAVKLPTIFAVPFKVVFPSISKLPVAVILPLALTCELAVIAFMKVVSEFITKGLLPDSSEKEPDKPVIVPLALILPDDVIAANILVEPEIIPEGNCV